MRGAVIEAALLLAAGLVVAECTLCRPGHTWWSPELESCLNCTRCDSDKRTSVVLRPCHVHQDTVCGTLSELGIDWSWLRASHNEHRHAKHHRERQRDPDRRRIIWRFPPPDDGIRVDRTTEVTPPKSDEEYQEYADYDMEVQFDSEPLLSDDQFVWDWQTVVLAMASFTCVLFFVVVAFYSVYYVRQWRMFKKKWNIDSVSDVEALSAKLNLMMASSEMGHFAEAPQASGTENQYSNLRCAYLEQLLVGKSKGKPLGPNNFYIQENNNC